VSFLEIFQPELRHLREERDRLKTLVSKPTPGGGAPLGIDLDTGRATIRMPDKEDSVESPPAEEERTELPKHTDLPDT
jgi:hypothetical protein